MNDDIRFAFDVAFSEPGVVEGKPVIESLYDMADTARLIIGELSQRFL
jgi:hypothetical protein